MWNNILVRGPGSLECDIVFRQVFFSRCENPDPAPFEKNNGKLKQVNPNKRKWRLAQRTRGVDDIAERTACEYAMNISLKMRESLQREVIKESYSIEGTKYACKEKEFWKKTKR